MSSLERTGLGSRHLGQGLSCAFDPEDPYAELDMADVGTDEAKRISLQMSMESNILLKNENSFLPLDRDDDIALIGHVGNSWYMDWYAGKPLYKVTLKAGLEKKMHREIPYESGQHLFRFRAGDKYPNLKRLGAMPRSCYPAVSLPRRTRAGGL